ncbi:MAG: energy-coupling factor transporter transmembrane component T family protein [Eggerthellaceae bacterium]
MISVPKTYVPGTSLVHRTDPRVKLILLLAYSVTLFLVGTWAGIALCAAVFFAVVACSGLSLGRLAKILIPLYFILFFTLLFNAFYFGSAAETFSVGTLQGGYFTSAAPVLVAGNLYFTAAGLERGFFYVVRIALLAMGGLVISYTTQAENLTRGLASLMSPLRKLRVPVDDLAMMLTVALRFIPLSVEELQQVRLAQMARYASFETGGPVARVKAWGPVMVPLFVNLFRRAGTLAEALECRCYGAEASQTSLYETRLQGRDWAVLVFGLAFCLVMAVLL